MTQTTKKTQDRMFIIRDPFNNADHDVQVRRPLGKTNRKCERWTGRRGEGERERASGEVIYTLAGCTSSEAPQQRVAVGHEQVESLSLKPLDFCV